MTTVRSIQAAVRKEEDTHVLELAFDQTRVKLASFESEDLRQLRTVLDGCGTSKLGNFGVEFTNGCVAVSVARPNPEDPPGSARVNVYCGFCEHSNDVTFVVESPELVHAALDVALATAGFP